VVPATTPIDYVAGINPSGGLVAIFDKSSQVDAKIG
jgi:hypothetical protein